MSKEKNVKKNLTSVKPLLNFAERECVQYDISEYLKPIISANGGKSDRFINLSVFVDVDNRKEILKVLTGKNKNRYRMALNFILKNQIENDYYEIEYKPCLVGAFKFKDEQNTRIITQEIHKPDGKILVMIEPFSKKVKKNQQSGKYMSRLQAPCNYRYYYKDKATGQKIYLK